MKRSILRFALLYTAVSVVLLLSILFNWHLVHLLVKPMFMVMLMVFMHFSLSGKHDRFSVLVMLGLYFSWIGDIALMFDEVMPIFFVVGLGAFLIAHVFYVAAFFGNIVRSAQPFNISRAVLYALPFIAFTGLFFFSIQNGIPAELYVPVLAYTVVISTMGIAAAWRHKHVSDRSFRWILAGAILFILSDCVIAINKFVIDFDHDAVVNMILYLSGQFMITLGALEQALAQRSGSADS